MSIHIAELELDHPDWQAFVQVIDDEKQTQRAFEKDFEPFDRHFFTALGIPIEISSVGPVINRP